MRKRWYVLAALVGGLAAFAVWVWPQRPLWRSSPEAGELRGFSPDGQVLITVFTPYNDNNREWLDPVLSRWDAATGKLLSRATLPCADRRRVKFTLTSPDGLTAMIGSPKELNDPRWHWHFHDGITGERQTGPIIELVSVPHHAFSADGQWFYCGRFRADTVEVVLFRANTAEVVLKMPKEDYVSWFQCHFAPDGATLAISLAHLDPASYRHHTTIRILELPSGRERCRFDPPTQSRVSVRNWDGRFLQVWEDDTDFAPDKTRSTVRTYDLEESPIGEGVVDPLLCYDKVSGNQVGLVEAKSGPNWVAYFSTVAPQAPRTGWGSRIVSWLGLRKVPSHHQQVHVRVVDRATGATRYETPRSVGYRCNVSPDGCLLACPANEDAIEVWDMNPSPRWPKALAAVAAGTGCMLGLGRYRSRRQKSPRI